MKSFVVVIALLAFVVGLVGHLAGASFANSDAFGYIAAPTPSPWQSEFAETSRCDLSQFLPF